MVSKLKSRQLVNKWWWNIEWTIVFISSHLETQSIMDSSDSAKD